ncbi:Tetracycline resistance protein TetA/multidrug resistance protein MdtG [Penicillium cataractarum]|uniref:Tetracycline resistance protein TetA/multidrug resistance protein MdtG n=1 Tax=Penicillium cataractarum TaxID=2100454 RepID=A0A9W9VI92_9EURO|nr:Tetracycline resistance protein TetA/multidrug resistance protein MdtG [Penicillium cataractarum]KAJ5380410.1 Tetracycline resistance protein TetA/multidrug resistance protein MdtG [Penicillium cataractarum]
MASDPYLLSEVLAIANIHPFYVPKIKYPPDEETVKAVQEQVKRDAKKVNLSSQSLLQKHNLSMDLIAEICENGGASVLCGETFMYGFIVPILGFMIKDRLHIDPSQTQKLTSNVLAFHGAISVISGPVIGHFADKVESQRTSLLISMLGCIIGTLMVASAHYVTVLFTGRFLQSIAESTVWIVGLTTVTGIVPENQLGTVMGVMMSFINTGMLTGPIASGFLLERAGYWEMWSVPLVVLTLNIIACLIMVEPTSKQSCEPEAMGEAECLLANRVDPQSSPSPPNFWKLMLCDSRVLTVWLVGIASTTVSTSFHATLPLHVQEVFGWGPSMTGLLFSCFSLPTLFVGPLAGWVRDTIGAKLPATASLAVQAGLLGLAGVAGNDQFSWARRQGAGPALYIVSLLAIGALRPFMSAIGPAELSTIVKEYQARTPGNFGPQGGLSRVFSMVDVSASFGMMIGPIIGGVLKETIGYTYMSCAFGM